MTLLTDDQTVEMAGDLLRDLSPHIGDADAIEAEFIKWIDALGVPSMSMVLLAAVRLTFTDCLTLTGREDWPPAGLAFSTRQEAHA